MGSFKISKYNDKNTVQPYLSFLLFKILTCWILEKKGLLRVRTRIQTNKISHYILFG